MQRRSAFHSFVFVIALYLGLAAYGMGLAFVIARAKEALGA